MSIFHPFWGEKLDKPTKTIKCCFYFIRRQRVEFNSEYLWALDRVQEHCANAQGILTHTVTQMDLEDIQLSEVDQTQGTDIVWPSLHDIPSVVKFTEAKSRLEERGNRSYWLMHTEFVSEMKQMLLTIARKCQCNATESYTLNGKSGRFYVMYILP